MRINPPLTIAGGAAMGPRFPRPYTDLVYQPILAAMEYLRQRFQNLRRYGRWTACINSGSDRAMLGWIGLGEGCA
jgi:hypothetical protein